MMWTPPLVELIRSSASTMSPVRFLPISILSFAALLPGCSALPSMSSASMQVAMINGDTDRDGSSDAEKLRRSQLPDIPDFDQPQRQVAAKPTAPVEVDRKVVVDSPVENAREQSVSNPSNAQPAKSQVAPAAQPIVGAGQLGVSSPDATNSPHLPVLRVDAPKPFAWKATGSTSGNRSFQMVTIGDEGYRSLVIGSVAGEDPLATELVELLARHLHNGKSILGGFQSTVLRTLNPDGEALHGIFNEKGQYINHGFPKDGGVPDVNQPVEVTFLLEQIKTLQPQRVIHIRTIEGNTGLMATSAGCRETAADVAEWLGFQVIDLPQKAVSGSLERHLASSGNTEIVTFAIPASSKKEELWSCYGDALQNLLLGEDLATREMARQQGRKSSASRKNAEDK